MRTITIEGLHVLAQVGVLAHEFGAPQPLLISALRVAKPPAFADCDTVSVEVHVQHSQQDGP